MKKEFCAMPPAFEGREMYGFSWIEHVTAIPSPLFVVTSYKENGKTNATLQSWSTFSNDDGFFCVFGNVNKRKHMYKTIKQTGALVVNFPSADIYMRCHATIDHNGDGDDEIALAGLTAERATAVNAPRIAECFLNLECEYVWDKDITPGGDYAVMCARVVNVVMDEAHYKIAGGRYGDTGYLYNVHSPANPETGEEEATCVAVLKLLATYDELRAQEQARREK